MKLLYTAAWLVIFGFLVWSGNLLLQIQSIGSETAELHRLSLGLDALGSAWRDLNRPGNDVLENYEVERQRAALDAYKQRYDAAWSKVHEQVRADSVPVPLVQPISDLNIVRASLVELAESVLDLAGQREALRQAQAEPELISKKETTAATAMARMDQAFQNGMDLILQASTVAIKAERRLERMQKENFQRLYVMLLVMLLVSALSVELIRHSMRQREALRDGAARTDTIVNNVVDAIITVDEDGAIESVNHSAERMFGYRADEIVGRQFSMLLNTCCRQSYRDQLRRGGGKPVILATFVDDACDGLGLRRDQSTFPIELAISKVTLKGRRLSIHIVRDVTERKQADQKQRLAASVFESATEGILVTDVDGTIQSVNPAYSAMTQYDAEELLGKNPRMLQSGKQDADFYQKMWASISGSGHWQGEVWDRRKDGEIFPLWVTINAIKDNRGRTTNYVGVAWDISELKASQRMKEEFITTVSHELRTPLTSVLGSLGMLTGTLKEQLPEQAQRLIALAHSNSRRVVRLINDILDIEKIEAGSMTFEFEPLDLNALVHRVIEDSKALAEQAQVAVSFEALSRDVRVNGDADRLMQAVTNILSNAIKFSRPGDPVEVVVDGRGAEHRVEVRDHGPGIPEEFHDRIFKKFVQAGRRDRGWKAGTGLGLSIAKLIVEQHGGRIDFQSSEDVGSTFVIHLPKGDQEGIEPAPMDRRVSTG